MASPNVSSFRNVDPEHTYTHTAYAETYTYTEAQREKYTYTEKQRNRHTYTHTLKQSETHTYTEE